MNITAEMVKELREKTGLGMMICKAALAETDGDMTKAIENLRKQGQATAAKRAGKAAKEGRVSIVVGESCGVVYEVNCETDFVARNEDFLALTAELGKLLLAGKPADVTAALALASPAFSGRTVAERIEELMGKIGEKITFRRFALESYDRSEERIFSYIHGDGKIGVMVRVAADKSEALDSPAVQSLGKDLAMQIAAATPIAPDRAGVPRHMVDKEREIYLVQVQNSGKPEKIWDKIVEGKLNKFYEEAVLVEQPFIRDTDKKVAARIKEAEKEAGAALAARSFCRYELGAEEQAA